MVVESLLQKNIKDNIELTTLEFTTLLSTLEGFNFYCGFFFG